MLKVSVLATQSARAFSVNLNRNIIIDSCTWKIIFQHHIFMLLCFVSPLTEKRSSFDYRNIQFQHPELPSFQLHLKCLIFYLTLINCSLFSAISTYVNVTDISPRLSDHIPVGNLIRFLFLLVLLSCSSSSQSNYSSATYFILTELCLFHSISLLCRQPIAIRCSIQDILLTSLTNCPSITSSPVQRELKELFQRLVPYPNKLVHDPDLEGLSVSKSWRKAVKMQVFHPFFMNHVPFS